MSGTAEHIGWALEALLLAERELLLFAGFWLAVGLVDELAVDLAWLWLRITGRAQTRRLPAGYGTQPLGGPIAVFVPAFAESQVIGQTIAQILRVWPQHALRLYVGCYRNDPATVAAAMSVAGDARLRLVLVDAAGPTTKADCLNRLYRALLDDEARSGIRYRGVVLHDAEDMVHPAALQAIDTALGAVDFVQLPVRPVVAPGMRWIAGHYADEFSESHAKTMVMRSALDLALPAAGVGCGMSRAALDRLVAAQAARGTAGPFAPEALTEDYEMGLTLSRGGRGSAFLRLRDADGSLIATSSCFPDELGTAVRQKTRWIHGIAFQGWDRLGWSGSLAETWMALRDRRGPLTALVLTAAYLLLALDAMLVLAQLAGWVPSLPINNTQRWLLGFGLVALAWRGLLRALFVGHEYGAAEAVRAVLRIPIANVIAIMAARRALVAYVRSLGGIPATWDKTEHLVHPASLLAARVPA